MAAFWKKFNWGKKKDCDQSKCNQGQCPKPATDQDQAQTNSDLEQNETKTTSTN